ncbi:MAG: hypothetical protein K8R53_04135 [Bacteroidales bacterium]|nr:hypothetical protein [Bacteroidales bacterium]
MFWLSLSFLLFDNSAIETARIAHFANGKKPRITIIDKNADTEKNYFKTRYPYYEFKEDVKISELEELWEKYSDIDRKLVNAIPAILKLSESKH